ncbi:hypothetical protein BKA67DRAFT_531297 [Truncatella angustata]|uniref:Uncharacterized protein n=1 Tax=Truncatella angustata TaxID=152316 RepID=A0A9P9A5E0_9PEZI|nr:uncharacterized protein BKA67DRAFT_531297 [Truncatella angustata]KAH6661235.1 hypothetical protein BKA67DRAFT_531297 [Truncatella angustata]
MFLGLIHDKIGIWLCSSRVPVMDDSHDLRLAKEPNPNYLDPVPCIDKNRSAIGRLALKQGMMSGTTFQPASSSPRSYFASLKYRELGVLSQDVKAYYLAKSMGSKEEDEDYAARESAYMNTKFRSLLRHCIRWSKSRRCPRQDAFKKKKEGEPALLEVAARTGIDLGCHDTLSGEEFRHTFRHR